MAAKLLVVLSCVIATRLITGANGTCSWPSALAGTWYTSESATWVFESNGTFLTMDFASFGSQSFQCYLTDGYRYLARIDTILVFPHIPGYFYDIFICLEFQQLSAYSFLYWRNNAVNPSLNNEKAFMAGTNYPATMAEACTVTKPYGAGTHLMLVKQGDEANAAVTCPSEFNSISSYYYDYDLLKECGPNNSSYSGCNSTDTMHFTYSACLDSTVKMLYSSEGALYCLYFTTDSGKTYLTVLNQDASPDGSSTYRFTCVVFAQSGSVIFATEYPEVCQAAQTSTAVVSPGEDLRFDVTSTCVAAKNHSESSHAPISMQRQGWSHVMCWITSVCLFFLLAGSYFP